ncbi:transcription antitermination factor NusB [Pseudofulvibacter geojedonensis]|uniref:Transcription antitermination factor NusB n=1 Tax=Pseudofulvibacter geojedonensis TaxID=1123758 RepID=A0ABW3I1R1_9FLAO
MLNRRHIRKKVMQSLFELQLTNSQNLDPAYKKLNDSLQNVHNLYALQLQLFTVILQKAQKLNKASQETLLSANKSDKAVRLVNNMFFNHINSSQELAMFIENNKLANWELDDEYASLFLNEILSSEFYQKYTQESSSFEKDRELILFVFKKIIAPNDKLYSYYEDSCISWVDDLPIVNTVILKQLKKMNIAEPLEMVKLYKDAEDKMFARTLLNKVYLNDDELAKYVDEKTPKWDADRIATIDAILMKMAICEFLKFPSIPVKVTINEYLEIAKEYSTKKSSVFINGILDSLSKDFKEANKLQKMGRGLM